MKPKLIKKPVSIKKESTAIKMSFQYRKIEDINFNCTSLKNDEFPIDLTKLKFSINWSSAADKVNKLIKIKLTIRYKYLGNPETVSNIILHTNVHDFYIDNFNEVVTNITEKGNYIMNNNFMMNLLSISIATTRGVLTAKLASTKYSSFILPIVSGVILKEIFETGVKPNANPK